MVGEKISFLYLVFALDDIGLTECSNRSSDNTESKSTKTVSKKNSNELIVRSTPSPVKSLDSPVRAGSPALRPDIKDNVKPLRSIQNVKNTVIETVQVTISTTSSTRSVYKIDENEGWKPFIKDTPPKDLPDYPKPTFFSFRSPPTPKPRKV